MTRNRHFLPRWGEGSAQDCLCVCVLCTRKCTVEAMENDSSPLNNIAQNDLQAVHLPPPRVAALCRAEPGVSQHKGSGGSVTFSPSNRTSPFQPPFARHFTVCRHQSALVYSPVSH